MISSITLKRRGVRCDQKARLEISESLSLNATCLTSNILETAYLGEVTDMPIEYTAGWTELYPTVRGLKPSRQGDVIT